MLGTAEYATSVLAQASNTLASLPPLVTSHAEFVGRIIIQKNAVTGIIVESAFTTTFQTSTPITDHGALTGLGDDDHVQYHTDARGDVRYEPKKGAEDNYVTDAQLVIIGNTSNTNSGDNATNSQYSGLAASKENTGVAAGLDAAHAALTTGVHGAGANSFIYSNDSRLTDARSPVTHNQDATTITTGALDGDRLPGLSATKKGGVPATGAPSGKYLRDDGVFATPAGGGGASLTEVEIDFGSGVAPNTSMTITDGTINAGNRILIFPSPNPATGRKGNDWELDSAVFTGLARTGDFLLSFMTATKIIGLRKIYYQVV